MSMTLETIRAAHARIAPYIVPTPLLRLPGLHGWKGGGCSWRILGRALGHFRWQLLRCSMRKARSETKPLGCLPSKLGGGAL